MSLADPLSLTITGLGTISLPNTSEGEDRSEYTSADGLHQFLVSHDYGKRVRRMIRFDTSKLSADTFKPAENVKNSMSVYTVFDLPASLAGYPNADALNVWVGYNALLTATSNAVITKVLGGES